MRKSIKKQNKLFYDNEYDDSLHESQNSNL